ncbi:hypothetical protein CT0861_06497 [Colletotrichum tofieldiae]|uniref:Uncharacterized protein n=1 Tax=Colletotrichum tofieldiae TaxID=708197 RepID=A0A166YCW1_9PEZI|nr:hypothetical protein CT0861_06497 [Colletotrichum tofieldiae]
MDWWVNDLTYTQGCYPICWVYQADEKSSSDGSGWALLGALSTLTACGRVASYAKSCANCGGAGLVRDETQVPRQIGIWQLEQHVF